MNIKDFSDKILDRKEESGIYDIMSDPKYHYVFRNISNFVMDALDRDEMTHSVWYQENKTQAYVVAQLATVQTIICLAISNLKKRMQTDVNLRQQYIYSEDALIWQEVQRILEPYQNTLTPRENNMRQNTTTSSVKASDALCLEDVRRAVAILNKNINKPIWGFNKEFPFFGKFYKLKIKYGRTH